MAIYDTDYDLAIFGGSLSSRMAACTAAQKGARVALIAPHWQISDMTRYTLAALSYAGSTSTPKKRWAFWRDWVALQCAHTVLSPAALNSQGVDVILEPASFTRGRRLKLANRYLKAKGYLLTDGYATSGPMATGLLCHQLAKLETLPKSIGVIGYGATALEWAYALSHHAKVVLILQDRSLLPAEDEDIQRLAAAQLRSIGVKVIFSHNSPGSDECQFKAEKFNVEQLVIVPQPYAWETLALSNVGIASDVPMAVNVCLQTQWSQLYVTGSSLGGENRPELTQQEISIALVNALFGRRLTMQYERVLYGINLLSPIGRWGLTERQARRCYGRDVQIFQAFCLPVMAENVAQINFCKLIILGQQIIGMHLMGDGAPTLAAALGNKPDMQTLSPWITASFRPGTLLDVIYQAIDQWKHCRWCEGQWRRDGAENWFNFRRSL
ncbi:NAD(P)/FAD-dependent oxidoreductase [Leptolyngbyaceae cyanobacterium CCMR0082]|uniref:NAD(P)/FAD-dependent oxidoreductase n=2 Tax=Adonisia turfae TaxID=2950184 RepID=A0A6M0S7S3_9CYAN|nr:NAD-binding protein [Adonisia turfae]NEZ56572.1 NAD(P)/FAD-dependent oxidoreductase [Adonisia turfae CCMR0081]NEZ64525.1 NAD(P)/FAD-dependent oxidoreductase [Adonisia turfae CCMR0082]